MLSDWTLLRYRKPITRLSRKHLRSTSTSSRTRLSRLCWGLSFWVCPSSRSMWTLRLCGTWSQSCVSTSRLNFSSLIGTTASRISWLVFCALFRFWKLVLALFSTSTKKTSQQPYTLCSSECLNSPGTQRSSWKTLSLSSSALRLFSFKRSSSPVSWSTHSSKGLRCFKCTWSLPTSALYSFRWSSCSTSMLLHAQACWRLKTILSMAGSMLRRALPCTEQRSTILNWQTLARPTSYSRCFTRLTSASRRLKGSAKTKRTWWKCINWPWNLSSRSCSARRYPLSSSIRHPTACFRRSREQPQALIN